MDTILGKSCVKFLEAVILAGSQKVVDEKRSKLLALEADDQSTLQERERAEQERRIHLESALLDASDAVWNAEQVLKREGPKTPDEDFSWRFVMAANSIHWLRE